MKIKVVKRSGLIEDFEQNKIAQVVKAAGLKSNQAKELAAKVAKWTKNTGKNQVTSLEIRDEVLQELPQYNNQAAQLFTWYQHTKDKKQD